MVRRVKRRTPPAPEPAPKAVAKPSNAHVRRWAESKGMVVKRVGKTLVEAYLARDPDDDSGVEMNPTFVRMRGGQEKDVDEYAAIKRPTGRKHRSSTCGFCLDDKSKAHTKGIEWCPSERGKGQGWTRDAEGKPAMWWCKCFKTSKKHPNAVG